MSPHRTQEPPVVAEYGGAEIYPMPMFATLAVRDVAAVSAWYQDALGFFVLFGAPAGPDGQPSLVHLRRRKYQDLLLVAAGSAPGSPDAAASLTLSFDADGEVDGLAEQARAAAPLGAGSAEGPVRTAWNTRDLRITDPAGHRLVFFERDRKPEPAQVARMQALIDAGRPR